MKYSIVFVVLVGTFAGFAKTSPAPPCPVDIAVEAYFSDSDCSKFWQCAAGIPYQLSCATGLNFNPTLNVCDWPDSAGCTGRGWSNTTTTTTEATTTSTSITTARPSTTPTTTTTTSTTPATRTTTTTRTTSTTTTTTTPRPTMTTTTRKPCIPNPWWPWWCMNPY
ncbi:unnamed protein product [Ceutorhynchus assimilis]|uniref:Chitin-binding type-2 domain-containing protein n=1 Tax=Ceutorhynchus assimilis TaxID=467358 RepID=A0A9N9M8S4_9CUCU|nr:unnamed protein product [Ceutorhynchus assimilis]